MPQTQSSAKSINKNLSIDFANDNFGDFFPDYFYFSNQFPNNFPSTTSKNNPHSLQNTSLNFKNFKNNPSSAPNASSLFCALLKLRLKTTRARVCVSSFHELANPFWLKTLFAFSHARTQETAAQSNISFNDLTIRADLGDVNFQSSNIEVANNLTLGSFAIAQNLDGSFKTKADGTFETISGNSIQNINITSSALKSDHWEEHKSSNYNPVKAVKAEAKKMVKKAVKTVNKAIDTAQKAAKKQ